MRRTRVTVSLLALAFTAVLAAGGPSSIELVRSTIDCGGRTVFSTDGGDCGDCGFPDPGGQPGCSDPACQDIVCAVIPSCCDTAWDALCAAEARTNCDCPSGFRLKGTIGQFDTGVMSGGDFVLAGGLWGGEENPCPGDCDPPGDGLVGVNDFLQLLAEWGGPGSCDIDGNGVVDVGDFLDLLAFWGPCP
jgi:hypothetical protein